MNFEVDELEFEDDYETVNENSLFTVDDFREFAKKFLILFFKEKKNSIGGNISESMLLTDRNISMVMNMDICNGIPLIYEALEEDEDKQIEIVLGLLRECAKMHIPKVFIAGIIAVYMELCKGIYVDFV